MTNLMTPIIQEKNIKHMSKTKNYMIYVLNNMNMSVFTEFCKNKKALSAR